MRVRDWQDILEDVATSDVDPGGWRAIGGGRAGGIGEDVVIGHPRGGVFYLKTYAKNPFEVQGLGTRVARRIDEDIDPLFPGEDAMRFGVQQRPDDADEAEAAMRRLSTVLETHADAPTTPTDLLDDVFEALDSPAHGPMAFDRHDRPEDLDALADTFEEAESVLDAEFEDVIEEDVTRGFQ